MDANDGLDLSDLDLSSIEFSEREMQALSGLTPALSRRLQRQLLAHLPPQAAARLRRTLSLNAAPVARPPYARSNSASKTLEAYSPDDPLVHTFVKSSAQSQQSPQSNVIITPEKSIPLEEIETSKQTKDQTENCNLEVEIKTPEDINSPLKADTEVENKLFIEDSTYKKHSDEVKASEEIKPSNLCFSAQAKPFEDCTSTERFKSEDAFITAPQFCTLPRLRRRSTLSRESVSPNSTADFGCSKDSVESKSSPRRTPDRPLLSKYLAPERNTSLDESYSSDSGSILSEPSYIAAYGSPTTNNTSGIGFRRHSLRLTGDQSKKRISRFLRSDFFDGSMDDSVYVKHKKEKEIETQKILKEIRDKKNKFLETTLNTSPDDDVGLKDSPVKKCLSPVSNLLLKERSRSTTPFFPILDNIKETILDSTANTVEQKQCDEINVLKKQSVHSNNLLNKESRMIRPKSYPIKSFDGFDKDTNKTGVALDHCKSMAIDADDKKLNRESKLLRPKSYPSGSSSPEKVYLNCNVKNEETKSPKVIVNDPEIKTDIEVSFSITLPKKQKSSGIKVNLQNHEASIDTEIDSKFENKKEIDSTLTLKKYQVVSSNEAKTDSKATIDTQIKNTKSDSVAKICNNDINSVKNGSIKEEKTVKPIETQTNEKKVIVKKKVVKKVSSKSKTDLCNLSASGSKTLSEKKSTKKVREKVSDDNANTSSAPKKKSVFQSIGQKLEKFASSKSNSPEKVSHKDIDIESNKINRAQRENSVPANVGPPTESNLIKRAVTITDVATLENQSISQNKTTVSKVLGLFKKFEPREKIVKPVGENELNISTTTMDENLDKKDAAVSYNIDIEEKPKRPTSLLLNGLGRKNTYSRSSNNNCNRKEENDNLIVIKKENEFKNIKNSLKLDLSRLPRVKKIVPTSPVIEPQIMNSSIDDKNAEKIGMLESQGNISEVKEDLGELDKRSRSGSRSNYSNSDIKSEQSGGIKDKYYLAGSAHNLPLRSLDSITPEKEDIVDRIRRKSFYSRFNEKKQRRKSSLVGPGATEYDPLARIHSHSNESKYDVSPTSPINYDLSPGLSVGSDISPNTERYRSLLTDLPTARNSLVRYDGANDKVDVYRSLDRNDLRKYSGSRSYLDYDQPSSYSSHRYGRTKSLFDNTDNSEDQSYGLGKDSHNYNRANSLYSPGSYATYRPKRTRNSAIILKESEKEPSPENILEKIRQRKISISVTRKSDSDKDSVSRSNVSPKGEGDGTERSSKAD